MGGKYGIPTCAHRVVFEHYKGPIPKGMFVCHSCDNPPCCNPEHLFLGFAQDNSNDMKSKNRQPFIRGEKHGNCKFSKKLIEEIKSDMRSYKKVCEEFKISKSMVSYIKNNKTRVNG